MFDLGFDGLQRSNLKIDRLRKSKLNLVGYMIILLANTMAYQILLIKPSVLKPFSGFLNHGFQFHMCPYCKVNNGSYDWPINM